MNLVAWALVIGYLCSGDLPYFVLNLRFVRETPQKQFRHWPRNTLNNIVILYWSWFEKPELNWSFSTAILVSVYWGLLSSIVECQEESEVIIQEGPWASWKYRHQKYWSVRALQGPAQPLSPTFWSRAAWLPVLRVQSWIVTPLSLRRLRLALTKRPAFEPWA